MPLRQRVTEGVTALAASVLVVAACSPSGATEIQSIYQVASAQLVVEVEKCNADLTASVDESTTEVRIEIHSEGGEPKDCADAIGIELESPLGDRRIYDVVAERYVALRVED